MEIVKIWGDRIPGNSSKSKLEDMNLSRNRNTALQTLRMVLSIKGTAYTDKKSVLDTMTYLANIKPGIDKETYEDEPCLHYYPAANATRAVIVVPGGAYTYRSMEGEGSQVAEHLNRAGIAAFVLYYRLNPYRMPLPLLDVQRAVRYVRFHAVEFGVDPRQISLIGFSAGGFEVAGHINLLQGKNWFPEDYQPDEIDTVEDSVEKAALIYPCLCFRNHVPMMHTVFDAAMVRDEVQRNALLDAYDCIGKLTSQNTPQFVCYGTKDDLVPPVHALEYVQKLRNMGADVTLLEIPGANHGFGAPKSEQDKTGHWIRTYIEWLQREPKVILSQQEKEQ